jgi:pimeloyl-ACP methyl ester carboxylesterase
VKLSTIARTTAVLLALTPATITAQRAVSVPSAGRQVIHRFADADFAIEIAARDARVEIAMTTTFAPSRMLLLGQPLVFDPHVQTIRGFFDPDTIARFVREARAELAVPDSVRWPGEGRSNPIRVDLEQPGVLRMSVSRGRGYAEGIAYGIGGAGCYARKAGGQMPRAQWRRLVGALGRASQIARQRRSRGVPQPRARVYVPADLPCPARAIPGNPPPRLPAGDDFLRGARDALLEADVRADGKVLGRSVRQTAGAADVGAAARKALPGWRFAPARNADNARVAQRVRLLAVDRAPNTRADTLRLIERVREQRADDVMIAARSAPPVQRTIGSGRVQIRATIFGGVPGEVNTRDVLFIPGPGGGASDWETLARSLGPGFRAVSYDLRGHGLSSEAPDADYSLGAHLVDLEAVFKLVPLAGPVVVAFGGSAAIATAYARKYPDHVAALVLLSPETDTTRRHFASRLELVYGILTDQRRTDLDGMLVKSLGSHWDATALLAQQVIANDRRTSTDAVAGTVAAAMSYDLRAELGAYRGPTVLTYSRESGLGILMPRQSFYVPQEVHFPPEARVRVRLLPGTPWGMLTAVREVAELLRAVKADLR